MATKLQRYEASVKLSTGHVVTYHNINTGLYKFHKFICEKFDDAQKWIYYSVRRKENKEEIGTFTNATADKEIHAVKIYVENQPNPTGTGFIFSFPFVRENFSINRNLFVAKSQVLDRNEEYILITEYLYRRMIKEAKNALYEFYSNKGHQIMPDEFFVGEIQIEKKLVVRQGRPATQPSLNYP